MTTDATPAALRLTDGLGLAPERAAFEAWARSKKCPPELLEMGGDYGGRGLVAGQWAAWQAAAAAERERPRQVLAYMATSREGTVRFTDNPDAARELEDYGWAITPLADAGPNAELTG